MSYFDCAILGGGPAGLFAALSSAGRARELGRPLQIAVFERNGRAGRKLLVTGGGQCNITQDVSATDLIDHFGDHGRFLRHAVHTLPPKVTMRQFESMGLSLITREDGKVFPASLQASDVLQTLLDQCDSLGIQCIYHSRITKVDHNDGVFTLCSGNQTVATARTVILATGGASYPNTGSTGDGYELSRSLGHTVIPPRPGLSSVAFVENSLGVCSGISLESVSLSFTDQEGKRRQSHGPLLITHTGLSGPVVLHASRYFAETTDLTLCWLPRDDGRPRQPAEIERSLWELCTAHGSANLSTIVHRIGIPARLAQWFLQEANVDGSVKAAEVGKRVLGSVARILAAQRLTVSLQGALKHAMVTAGGIALSEIDPKRMESRIVPGLFVAGEVLDIDGDTGGYNLQSAWSTGFLAGTCAAESVLGDSSGS